MNTHRNVFKAVVTKVHTLQEYSFRRTDLSRDYTYDVQFDDGTIETHIRNITDIRPSNFIFWGFALSLITLRVSSHSHTDEMRLTWWQSRRTFRKTRKIHRHIGITPVHERDA